jgi:hypothetical protein
MKLLFTILFSLIAIFQTNIIEAKVIVFDAIVSETIFTESVVENKNVSVKILENDFEISCKSGSKLIAFRNMAICYEGNAAKGGTTVLGHYPEYVKLAESLGARRFQIPTSVWNKMSAAEQWTANTTCNTGQKPCIQRCCATH